MARNVTAPTTLEQLEALIAEEAARWAAVKLAGDPSWYRAEKARQAVADALPTSPAALALWLRWLSGGDGTHAQGGLNPSVVHAILTHVAEQLDGMARRPPEGAGPLSSTF